MLRTASRALKIQLLDNARLLPAAAQARTFSANVEHQLKEDLLKVALAHVPKLVRLLDTTYYLCSL